MDQPPAVRPIEYVSGHGGARLAVHRLRAVSAATGTAPARVVVLVHGLFSSAEVNWVRYGHAARLAAAGCDVIMPDLRAHGASDAPHAPAAYPRDVLVADLLAVIDQLAPTDFDLVGFSLGARTAVGGVLAGLSPRRLVLGGMGLDGLSGWARRSAFFTDAIDRFDTMQRGDPAWFPREFMRSQAIDRVAARLLLASVADIAAQDLARVTMPALVVCGAQDQDNGSGPALAAALPGGRFAEVPGTHMSSVVKPQLGEAIADFLAA